MINLRPTAFLIALAATPAFAQTAPPAVPVTAPPTVVPTLAPPVPAPAPVILPTLSDAQAAFLQQWLRAGSAEGIGGAPDKTDGLGGEALVRAALDRARALRTGRIEGSDFLEVWALRPALYDPLPDFAAAVASDRLAPWAAGLTPRYAGYEGLRKGLATYEAIRAAGGWPVLTAKAIPAAIRARLGIEDAGVFPTETVGPALQRAQRRYGLNPTGMLDARTLAALNVPVADRIAAIKANMERWRWLPRDLPVNRVQVNIAAAVLTVFEGDAPVTSMRAVTGRPGNETPMLTSAIHSIVINPPWNVPMSIARKELFPQGRATLKAKGYRIVGTPEGGERIVQPPGPNNALGQLKFDFDNPFAVYLHDTSARSGFSSYDRLASHGCVRLQKPVPLAQRFLEADPKWTPEALQAALDSGKTQRAQLPEKVTVFLLYWTAFASANGMMNFRDDPYNWDTLLAARIDRAAQRAAAPVATTALKGS
ncbi:MAG: L,D-transpeptidase family protein [Sphingomonadaceae bacterium]